MSPDALQAEEARAAARRRAPSLWWAILLLAAAILAGVVWASGRDDGQREPRVPPAARTGL